MAPEHDAKDDARAALVLRSGGVAETHRLGALLGRLLRAGDIVLLIGPLGAGKTAFTQGVGAGLGVAGTINSPTFTILKEYSGRFPLHHFDLYRIEDPAELFALGFEDYFGGDGVAVVEWAERGEAGGEGVDGGETAWPADYLHITFRATGPDERELECVAAGPRGHALLAALTSATESPASEGAGVATRTGGA